MEIFQDFKIIWIYLRRYKKAVRRTAVLALVFSIFVAFIPYIYGRLVDMVSSDSSPSFIVFSLFGIWVLMSLCSAVLKRIVQTRGDFISTDSLCDLIYEEASHIINLPLSFHREKRSGEILSKIQRASEFLRMIISDVVFWILPQFFTVFIGILILFFVDWRLSLGALMVFLFSIAITLYRTPMVLDAQRELNKKTDIALGELNDSFLNVQTIKSCAAEDFQKARIQKAYKKRVASIFKKVIVFWNDTVLFQEIIFSLGFIAIFVYAIFLLRIGQISIGKLVMFLGYLNLTQTPLRNLLWLWLSFQRGMTSIKKVRKILGLKTENYKKEGKVLKEIKGKVEFRDVSFRYPGKTLVLNKVSFSVSPGQKIAIVGGSGEGKTTLIDLLSLYFIPLKGKILIDDVNIKSFKLQFLRSIIAYVPQEIMLFNDTIKNNILYGRPNALDEQIIKAARAANINHFIELLPKKYETIVGERGIKLSTGQKQRLAIARALICDPKILVLDEATSSLDSESEKLIQQALEHLIKDKTTFIVAHRLSTVRKADKILVLEKGRIVEQGRHEELIRKKGAYFKFYSLQFGEQD